MALMVQLFENTGEKSVSKRLAHIVNDPAQDTETRLMAYVALVEIAGLPVWQIKSLRHFQIPADVDSDLLARFLQAPSGSV